MTTVEFLSSCSILSRDHHSSVSAEMHPNRRIPFSSAAISQCPNLMMRFFQLPTFFSDFWLKRPEVEMDLRGRLRPPRVVHRTPNHVICAHREAAVLCRCVVSVSCASIISICQNFTFSKKVPKTFKI